MVYVGLATVSLAVLVTTFASSASGHQSAVPLPYVNSSPTYSHTSGAHTCYNQHIGDGDSGILSQNFEKRRDALDSRGADDFTLDTKCTVTKVLVDGLFGVGNGPARSMHVTFYQDNDGSPGMVVSGQKRASYRLSRSDQTFYITLLRPVTLKPGHYWVSVKANMNSAPRGGWFWLTNNTVNGLPSQWRNARDGFGTGCTNYTTTTICFPGVDGDFSFALTS
jgi:hypothetical protein